MSDSLPQTATASQSPVSSGRDRRLLLTVLDTLAVVRKAIALFVAHWPTLFAIMFAGLAAREVVLLAAVKASAVSPVAGFLVFVFVPLSVLTALVLMLRVLGESLPGMVARDADGRRISVAAHLNSVMLPFLAVYSLSYMATDWLNYVQQVVADDQASSYFDPLERLIEPLGVKSLVIVAVAAGLRWFLAGRSRAGSFPGRGFVVVYLEVIWLSLAAWVIVEARDSATEWLQSRRIIGWGIEGWDGVVEQLGALTGPVKAVVAVLGAVLGSIEPVILIPFAWLAVGAVIYGRKLVDAGGAIPVSALRRWAQLPGGVRGVVAVPLAKLADTFSPLRRGLAVMRRAGLSAMLLFCLLAVTLTAVPPKPLVQELVRLIGPQDLQVWQLVLVPAGTIDEAISRVLLICLVAAAVDRALNWQRTAMEPVPTEMAGTAETAGSADRPASAGDGEDEVPGQLLANGDPNGVRSGLRG